MAKEVVEKTSLTINDGIRFGFGFFLVSLAGFAAIGLVSWAIILIARVFGLTF
jgi:hypothetical protein